MQLTEAKLKGNDFYKNKDYFGAITEFSLGVDLYK